MPAEMFVIDPDVWKGSIDDPRCQVAVRYVWDKPQRQIALDGGQMEEEYLELLRRHDCPDHLRKLLQEIFNQSERSPRIKRLNPEYPFGLDTELPHWMCDTPIEPVLIGMAAANVGAPVKLLLVGEDRLRRRGLHQREAALRLRRFFRDKLHKGFIVQYASSVRFPQRDEHSHGLERRVFEDQTRLLFINRVHKKFALMPGNRQPTPSEVEEYTDASGDKAGEVDVYLCVDTPEARHIWVCECELREMGNEGQPTTKEKVQKLGRKVDAIKAFESSCGKRTNVKGYLVTNATQMHPAAHQLLEDCDLRYCQVTMPKRWSTDYRWRLTDDNISPFEI